MLKRKRCINNEDEAEGEGDPNFGYGGYKGKKSSYYPPMGYMPPHMYEYPPMYGMDPYMMGYGMYKPFPKKKFKNKTLIVKKPDSKKTESKGESKPETSTS